jgi:TRAP-type mannitol/chloroaromatic compound transport system permease small subunit
MKYVNILIKFIVFLQDTLKDFLEKRENGELLYQKRSKLQQALFDRVSYMLYLLPFNIV